MNIPWNPDDPVIRVRIPDSGVLRYMIFEQAPTGWAFSGLSYMVSDVTPYEYIPKPVQELLKIKRKLGDTVPEVYFRKNSGEILTEDGQIIDEPA